jgi:type III secretion protein C
MPINKFTFKQYARLFSLLSVGAMGVYATTLIAEEGSAEAVAAPAVPTSLAVPQTNAVTPTPPPVIPPLSAQASPSTTPAQTPLTQAPASAKIPPAAQQIAANGTGPASGSAATAATTDSPTPGAAKPKTILINFNNVAITEYIRFISRVSNKNFVFDERDLQFNVTIVSEEPTTIENVMSALIQELRIHGLMLIEEGNNLIIHKAPGVNSISRVVGEGGEPEGKQSEIVTRLFRLNTVDPDKAATIIRPLVSTSAIVEVFKETNYVIVTDISSNILQIEKLLKSIDAPNSGMVIGQFVVRTGYIDTLIELAEKIMKPIAQEQTLIFVPHRSANSIFIVANPFLMERTLSILQYLDQNQGLTRIFDLKELKFTPEGAIISAPGTTTGLTPAGTSALTPGAPIPSGWQLDQNGNWVFRPSQEPGIPSSGAPPEGQWYIDANGNWRFQPGAKGLAPGGAAGVGVGPDGEWKLDSQGIWIFQLTPGKSISAERVTLPRRGATELPAGHIERTQFHMQKLYYRRGDQIQASLFRIANSLQKTSFANGDLAAAIESVQWIEASNSLIFTGTAEAIQKISELISSIDVPLKQIFLEMLILDTTVSDSMQYGVNWGTRFGGANTAGSQAFLSTGSPLTIGLGTTGVNAVPSATSLALSPGFNQGIIGQSLRHGGLTFSSIGALVQAVHSRTDSNVLLNPKILVEDNVTAEIFVGLTTQFPTQAITNDQGAIITQNFEYRDVGTRLRVTPQIGENGIITLTIEEEVSNVTTNPFGPGGAGSVGTSGSGSIGTIGPTTSKSNTRTRVHLPNGFFLVLSGIIQDQDTRTRNQVPCVGGIPFIGAAFSDKRHTIDKRNLLIFIRPLIIETDEEIDDITKHQQDVYLYRGKAKQMWQYETDEMMDFLNLPKPSQDPCRVEACEGCDHSAYRY